MSPQTSCEGPLTKNDLRIGIALPGGGVRTAVFHLGIHRFQPLEWNASRFGNRFASLTLSKPGNMRWR